MARWTKNEVKLLNKAYQKAHKNGVRVIHFPKKLLETRSHTQCLWQAQRLNLQRTKVKGFGLRWRGWLTEFEKYYIAGILDGEGYITNNYSNYTIGVGMTEKKLIAWLYKKLGGSFYLAKRQKGKSGLNKQMYVWKINGMKQVRSFLAAMLPYLKVKSIRARQIIKEIDKKSL